MKLPGLLFPEANILPQDGSCVLYENFLSLSETTIFTKLLLDQTEWQQYRLKMFGKEVNQPRLTAWYGTAAYTYSGLRFEPKDMSNTLLTLQKKVEDKCNCTFNSVLLNLYRNGQDSMGWHSDDEKELGSNPIIASLSLGEERLFQLRHKTQKDLKLKLKLSNGSLLCMGEEMQHHWQHAIPKASQSTKPRINLTFRNIVT